MDLRNSAGRSVVGKLADAPLQSVETVGLLGVVCWVLHLVSKAHGILSTVFTVFHVFKCPLRVLCTNISRIYVRISAYLLK